MAEVDSVRIEVAFEGDQILGANVTAASADALERAVNAGAGGTLQLDTDDGRLTVVVPRVIYLKRFARDARVGFGI
ncbi:MAG: hypothetical protein EXQ77_02945 [Thermoleophilia bacterium]|nr:hypothetical protein [Thermoleophilia bacterium]